MNDRVPSILQCPSCGASLPIEDEATITCQYCGNRILVPAEFRPPPRPPSQPAGSQPVGETRPQTPSYSAPMMEAPPIVQSKRLGSLVWLLLAIVLCVGVFLFIGSGRENSIVPRNLPNLSSDEGMPIDPQAQTPTEPVLPTFTPMAEVLLKFGEQGNGEGQMDDARFIAVDPHGNIFVGDYSGGRLQKFDPQGNFLLLINIPAPETDTDVYTRGIATDSQGNLYVARNGEILVFDGQDGELLNSFPDRWPDIYYDTLLIAGDTIYSTNGMAGTDDILKLSLQGEILLHTQDVIESVDKNDPALNMRMAVDEYGQIYILSNFGPHVYVYDAQGAHLFRFGEDGSGRGQLSLSSSLIAIDPRSRLYIASGFRIDQFDTQGNYLGYSIDVSKESDGGVPMGMVFDTQGFLYITCNNGKILKYQINSL